MKELSAFRLTLILILLGLVAVGILLGVLAYQDYREEGDLEDDWKVLELDLKAERARSEGSHDIGLLEAERDRLDAQLKDTEATHFPPHVDDSEITDLISETEAEVTVSWSIEGESIEPIGGGDSGYLVHRYEVEASGNLESILEFLKELEDDDRYQTLKLDEVDLTYDGGSGIWSIEFEVLVYAQPELE